MGGSGTCQWEWLDGGREGGGIRELEDGGDGACWGGGRTERRTEGRWRIEDGRGGQRRTKEADRSGQKRTEADKGDIAKCTN